MGDPKPVSLSICTRCRPPQFDGPDLERPGYRLAGSVLGALQQRPSTPLTMRGVRCMSQCKRPCVIALSAPGKYTLLFGDLDARIAAPAVLSFAEQYALSPDGLVARSERPVPLRGGILGRIPPLDNAGDGIDHDFTFPPHQLNTKET